MYCRFIPTLFAIGVASHLFAQSGSITPAPNWRLGDKRQVDVQMEMKMKFDTLLISTKSAATYYLEVASARKDGYELMVRSGSMETPSMDLGLGVESAAMMDSMQAILGPLFTAMIEPFTNLDFRYRVDRSGKVLGRIEAKDDKEKLNNAVQLMLESTMTTLSKWGDAPPAIPQAVLSHMVDSMYDAFLEVQKNDMNYFLKIYTTEFPLAGSLRQAVLLEDVDAPLHPDIPKLPGFLEAGIDKNDERELVGRTITTYDPDALFAYMKDNYPEGFVREGLYMDEECVERFDKRTGWLTTSTTAMRLRSKLVQMDMHTTTVLKVIR